MSTSGARGTPDSVSGLIALLSEERKNFTSIEIAETLWLAMQMEPAAAVVYAESVNPVLTSPPLLEERMEAGVEPELTLPPLSKPIPRATITAPTPQAGVLPPQVLPVYLADPAMLTDSLAIVRALKPLLQKVAAGTGKRLDEAATVDSVARTRLCLPILEPEEEPWFDIILVVDRGSSMHIWQRLVKDVVRILQRYGAFRDVQVFDLAVNPAAQSIDRAKNDDAVRLLSKPQRPGHRPSELIDQQGRRIVIVLSDCAGAYWWDGTLLPMLQAWGKIMPTVIWQMLPPWMWKRTALGRGTAVALTNDIPGVGNQRLKVQIQERHEPEDASQRLPVPVVTSEIRDLARWSLMVAGDRREATPGFLLPHHGGSVPRSKSIEEVARDRASVAEQSRTQETLDERSETDSEAAFNQSLEAIASERVKRFLELSSPHAQRLIMLLAAAPVITPPVVRLIRDAMLYNAQSPLPLAEVFLSGLLLRLPEQEDHELERVAQEETERARATLERQDTVQASADEPETRPLERQDFVQYDFAPKVRSILLASLPAVDTIEVLNSVSAAVERRWNQFSKQDFRAFLMNPAIEAPEGLNSLRSFASVTAEILEQLGGEYANLAQQLRQGVTSPRSAEEDNFPNLEPFRFVDARLIDGSEPAFPPTLQTEEFTVITFHLQPDPESFEFTVATLHRRATQQAPEAQPQAIEWEIHRQQQISMRFVETITDDIPLEMVAIPAGTFIMGSPNDEPEHRTNESPQHNVTLSPFFIGRYPITQAQWRFVALLPRVEKPLEPLPSLFNRIDRPVEQVCWYNAVEFCARLSVLTGRQYRLPTEAEWEFACRAHTTTPFHFGDMMTIEVANYNGSAYAGGTVGKGRGGTTAVDHFGIANAFGLSDMHGNVREWCQDHWHGSYEGAPIDGSAWLMADDNMSRVVRGGAWDANPRSCRSAYRTFYNPDYRNNNLGFRVCCSALKTL